MEPASNKSLPDDAEVDDSPVEEVRLTVPITDDPTLPCLTFRTWTLGIVSCATLAFLNQFFSLRQNPLSVSSVTAQIVVLPIGRLMARALPSRAVTVPGTKWSFSLNPGPFNVKEHCLITIFANAGYTSVYALNIVIIIKAFYHRRINPWAAILLSNTTQLLGYGWAGIYRSFLVDSPYMWWPSNLVQVSLFQALHVKDVRKKGGLTRLQFFIIVLISSFAYYLVPNYLFPSITAVSFVCWIWKDSVTAQQIGSGVHGLGIGSFAVDWSTVASFLGSPLATPGHAILNILVGYILVMFVALPLSYWTDSYHAKRFPLVSSHLFDVHGQPYNLSRVLNEKTFDLNLEGYNSYSKVHLSMMFVYTYAMSFTTLAATLSHVGLFYGRMIWEHMRASLETKFQDVHARLMQRNYSPVPQWWFYALLVVVTVLSIITCEGFGNQMQLPFWGVLLSMALALIFTLPIGAIVATTNQEFGLNVISEMVIGYMMPGKPLANVAFKSYSTTSLSQAINFLSDFKLGHYMKIPPRSMFVVQLVGTLINTMTCFSTAWWLLTSIDHICDTDNLPKGSPWTCPGDDVFYNASIIWGVVGPLRMFGKLGVYWALNYCFLFGLLAPVPVWYFWRKYPDKKWIGLINLPVLISGALALPTAKTVNYNCWFAVGLFFNLYIYTKYKKWWGRHNYVLSAALDAGVAFMGILCYFTLQNNNISGPQWWGLDVDDHCPLARCPTARGVEAKGCPVF